jgi:hypothetical protein
MNLNRPVLLGKLASDITQLLSGDAAIMRRGRDDL